MDLEKAYSRVPKDGLWICMRVKETPDKYLRLSGICMIELRQRLEVEVCVIRRDSCTVRITPGIGLKSPLI